MAAAYRLSLVRRSLTVRSAAVLRQYVREIPITRPFFDATPDAPLDAFAAEAARHPVFRISSGKSASEVTRSMPGRSA